MKTKDKQKLHQSSVAELQAQLTALQTEVIKTLNQLKLGKLKNTKASRHLRDKIVVIKTILHEKELAKKAEAQS